MEQAVDAPDESMKESRKLSAVEANMLWDLDLGGQEFELPATEGSEQVEVTYSPGGGQDLCRLLLVREDDREKMISMTQVELSDQPSSRSMVQTIQ